MSKIVIPDNPTPSQIEYYLSLLSNQIAKLSDLVAEYKRNAGAAETKTKRAYARAIVENKGKGNVDYVKALAEIDDNVIKAKDKLEVAETMYLLAKAELDGYDAQFVALRKIAEIRKTEMSRIHGGA